MITLKLNDCVNKGYVNITFKSEGIVFQGAYGVYRVSGDKCRLYLLHNHETMWNGSRPAEIFGFTKGWDMESLYLDGVNNQIDEVEAMGDFDCSNPRPYIESILDQNKEELQSSGDWVIYLDENGGKIIKDEEKRLSFINDNYDKGKIYTGFKSYHTSHGGSWVMNKPKETPNHYIGVELEIVGKDSLSTSKIKQITSNWVFMESDGSLPSNGVELITIPLLPKDAKSMNFWDNFCENISKYAISWKSRECGLHIHISKSIFGDDDEKIAENCAKVWYLYHYCLKNQDFNVKINGRSVCYSERDMSTKECEATSILGTDVLKQKSIREKVVRSCLDKSKQARYFDVNLQNVMTIEFRKGKGSINAERISALCRYYEDICTFCAKYPWSKMDKDNFLSYVNRVESKSSPVRKFIPRNNNEE